MKPEILGYSVNVACKAIPCGRTKAYQLIADGRLEAKKLGTKTIITRRSVERLLEELPDAGLAKPPKDEAAGEAAA